MPCVLTKLRLPEGPPDTAPWAAGFASGALTTGDLARGATVVGLAVFIAFEVGALFSGALACGATVAGYGSTGASTAGNLLFGALAGGTLITGASVAGNFGSDGKNFPSGGTLVFGASVATAALGDGAWVCSSTQMRTRIVL